MHGVHTEGDAEGRDERGEHHDRRIDLQHAPQDQQEEVEGEEERPLRVDVLLHPGEQPGGHLRIDEVAGESQSDPQQDDDAAHQRRGVHQHARQIPGRVDVAEDRDLDDDRVRGAERG